MTKTPLINANLLPLALGVNVGHAAGSRACALGASAYAPALLGAVLAASCNVHSQSQTILKLFTKNFIITNHGTSMTLQIYHWLSNHEIDSRFHLRLHNMYCLQLSMTEPNTPVAALAINPAISTC
jgi:hypothetical protein